MPLLELEFHILDVSSNFLWISNKRASAAALNTIGMSIDSIAPLLSDISTVDGLCVPVILGRLEEDPEGEIPGESEPGEMREVEEEEATKLFCACMVDGEQSGRDITESLVFM